MEFERLRESIGSKCWTNPPRVSDRYLVSAGADKALVVWDWRLVSPSQTQLTHQLRPKNRTFRSTTQRLPRYPALQLADTFRNRRRRDPYILYRPKTDDRTIQDLGSRKW